MGTKVTEGYLKKETESRTLNLKQEFQTKYCILDLSKFMFKYAKSEMGGFVCIYLKDIKDVIIEPDHEV